jgi:hypothetical protein
VNGILITIGCLIGGGALATATAVGIVQSQQSAGEEPISSTSTVNYGSN